MKTNLLRSITTAAASWIAAPVFALEAPPDDAPPPPPVSNRANKQLPEIKLRNPKVKAREEAAFLGVIPGVIPPVLAEHLGLNPGEGIVVTSLSPNGPAAQAGIRVNDVITHIADQPVDSQIGLTQRVVAHKPGEVVKITAIHKGKPTTFEAALGVRPAEVADARPQTLDALKLGGLPEDLADQIRNSIAGNLGGITFGAGQGQLDMLRRQIAGNNGNFKCGSAATVRMNDAAGSVEVKSEDESKEVTVRDNQNNVTWTGPWNTAKDKAAAPAEVSQRMASLGLDKATEDGHFQFNFGPSGGEDE